MATYDVILKNQLTGSLSEDQARDKLAQTFKISDEKVAKLLQSASTTIKRNLDEVQANRFREVIESCGYQAALKPLDTPTMFELEAVAEPEPQEPAQQTAPEARDVYHSPDAPVGPTVFCRHCGKSIEETATECVHCGREVYAGTGRSKVAAGFLAFLMGGFGIHRFYLKQWWGIFYIPLGLIGVSPLVTWIEAIYFWVCPQERWQRKYGHLPPSNIWVWVAICIIPFVMIIGILAAVALPAYQDYTIRVKTAEAINHTEEFVDRVEAFMLETNFVPNSALDANLEFQSSSPYLASIEIQEGAQVVATLAELSLSAPPKTIVFQPVIDYQSDRIVSVQWTCTGGTLEAKHRPARCRP